MSNKINAIRGMNDCLPKDSHLWLSLEKIIFDTFIAYGFKNIRTPVVEKTDTFCRAIGQTTDIVEKEMYTWTDSNGDLLSLRPENTAGVVRAMIEHNLPREGIQKVFYQGAMFRHERPQKGRYRQFHQIGAEVFGAHNAKSDAELIAITHSLWQNLGLKNITLEINTLGSNEARANYRSVLVDYFTQHKDQLDEDSTRRLKTNPLRILDSKNEDLHTLIEAAPKLMAHLDEESAKHFDAFKAYLECMDIPYVINTRLVRGLDYYNRTVFEWTTTDLGAQATICAGGRYDSLVEKMGGKPCSGVGFALGLERLILLIQEQNLSITGDTLSAYIVALGDEAQIKSLQIAEQLHEALPALILYNDITMGSFKSQFKKADKANADFAIILGEKELNNNQVAIKPLKGQSGQQAMRIEDAINYLKGEI
ncbi:Histidyl-tRNA synthetase (EC 6.1.1.21) [uncultured Gammaproteobacteria bacterium]|jgi:histidyl-tRNA synthetase|uniref:Histidyl-tRNA synthetase (EC) n=3 Tax=sulfur-oxidizing symbionts TaxID=32036 RepID=A0ACA8ZRM4_9GAMM|nr:MULTISPECIES: histidine--tRNA ligase [sulfur-oxidizing symbionts]CAC9507859.1 Histidyl-tRNA synthetase (EC 6.1.1.21) [uncultured Gammaproteobacteria bacterium]CAB5497492.1 Histidyl-tRNA synthetase (EC [Bathymodiolus thermophilus thioautotrophic gill symbiont]CAB5504642.1 Histidyl-tRNA synthetase (EC [Bathymodiolus azoricus thioautotrophic gill symbiont]CAC9509948.1 Histidyl-tRNA synthetase (EC 6.1.1.21) [uncultured Gammaproteobacteria bacterium]CAC9510539.1 Histidyl-tRNA synthetase (EC 6.1.